MKVKTRIFRLIFFLWVIDSMFTRDLEAFQGWKYGVGTPKVQEHEIKIPYMRYLNPFESFMLYLGQDVKAMKPFVTSCQNCKRRS